ncbi:MAG: LytTR family DNA-binding domain-containing protein [Bacteroidota bacterium]|nr:LytTR family DNA-binding domain-containing protein [Bacteroidota bacterium]
MSQHKINCVIIDDEINNRKVISKLLGLYGENISVAGTAGSVEAGYREILQHKPDLVFLDIEMQDGTGFDLLKRLDRIDFKIIFITAHQQYAIDAFRFCALDYLLKPVSRAHFITALEKARQSINKGEQEFQLQTLLDKISASASHKKKIVLKTMDRVYTVNTSEIVRMEADGSYTNVYLVDGKKILISRSLKEFDGYLSDEGFIRVHQSHLVNMDFLFCFEKQENHLVMKDHSIVPVSSRKKEYVLGLLNGN